MFLVLCVCLSSVAQCFILELIQASAPEDCRLMWPISSDYCCMVTVSLKHTCIQMRSGTKKNHGKNKPLDVVYASACFPMFCYINIQSVTTHPFFVSGFLFLHFFLFSTCFLLYFLVFIIYVILYWFRIHCTSSLNLSFMSVFFFFQLSSSSLWLCSYIFECKPSLVMLLTTGNTSSSEWMWPFFLFKRLSADLHIAQVVTVRIINSPLLQVHLLASLNCCCW